MRGVRAAAGILCAVALLAGCGGSRQAAGPSVQTPSSSASSTAPAPTDARPSTDEPSTDEPSTDEPSTDEPSRLAPGDRQAIEDVRRDIAEAPSFRVESAITGDGLEQAMDLVFDPRTSSFAGDIVTTRGDRRSELAVVRASRLTWVRSDADFWRELGYDDESARRAESKYVVFAPAEGERIAAAYDPSTLLRYVKDVDPARVVAVDDPHSAPAHVYEIGDGLVLRISAAGVFEISGDTDQGTVNVRYEVLPQARSITPPPRDQVLSPS